MKRAVRSLKSREGRETSFLLLSNANELFINTILTVRSSPSPLSLLSKPECVGGSIMAWSHILKKSFPTPLISIPLERLNSIVV